MGALTWVVAIWGDWQPVKCGGRQMVEIDPDEPAGQANSFYISQPGMACCTYRKATCGGGCACPVSILCRKGRNQSVTVLHTLRAYRTIAIIRDGGQKDSKWSLVEGAKQASRHHWTRDQDDVASVGGVHLRSARMIPAIGTFEPSS